MTTRTTQSVLRFPTSFQVSGLAETQPPGDYRVDREDEMIEGLSWTAWRRVGTFIHLPAIGSRATTQQVVRVDPAEVDAMNEKEDQQ